jgi:hypothetical protein
MHEVVGNDPKMREPNAIQPACIEAMRAVAGQRSSCSAPPTRARSTDMADPSHVVLGLGGCVDE